MPTPRVADRRLIAARVFTGHGDDAARRLFVSYHRARDLDVQEHERIVRAGGVDIIVHVVVAREKRPRSERQRRSIMKRIGMDPHARLVIETGGRGATYRHDTGFTVYALDTYPQSSVLAGQQRRTFVDRGDDLDELRRKYPTARQIAGTTYADIDAMIRHLADEGDR